MLKQDFRDMLLCLKNVGADFMIVGAYALAAHGFVRATGDIDIWIRNSSENAVRVMTTKCHEHTKTCGGFVAYYVKDDAPD